jgi:hypothetical protein
VAEPTGDLNERISQLEKTVEALRVELAVSRAAPPATMRQGRRCPACGDALILHVERIDVGDAYGPVALALVRARQWSSASLAPLELYACGVCGLVEWYVRTYEGLPRPHPNVTVLEPLENDSGPYR